MKNYRSKFFILITSVILGFLIIINIGRQNTNRFLDMNAVEYRDAIEERNKLYDEITVLSDDNYELSKKINKSLRTTKKIIKTLQDDGKLKREGGKKFGYWKTID